jgi:hypothetical protein
LFDLIESNRKVENIPARRLTLPRCTFFYAPGYIPNFENNIGDFSPSLYPIPEINGIVDPKRIHSIYEAANWIFALDDPELVVHYGALAKAMLPEIGIALGDSDRGELATFKVLQKLINEDPVYRSDENILNFFPEDDSGEVEMSGRQASNRVVRMESYRYYSKKTPYALPLLCIAKLADFSVDLADLNGSESSKKIVYEKAVKLLNLAGEIQSLDLGGGENRMQAVSTLRHLVGLMKDVAVETIAPTAWNLIFKERFGHAPETFPASYSVRYANLYAYNYIINILNKYGLSNISSFDAQKGIGLIPKETLAQEIHRLKTGGITLATNIKRNSKLLWHLGKDLSSQSDTPEGVYLQLEQRALRKGSPFSPELHDILIQNAHRYDRVRSTIIADDKFIDDLMGAIKQDIKPDEKSNIRVTRAYYRVNQWDPTAAKVSLSENIGDVGQIDLRWHSFSELLAKLAKPKKSKNRVYAAYHLHFELDINDFGQPTTKQFEIILVPHEQYNKNAETNIYYY